MHISTSFLMQNNFHTGIFFINHDLQMLLQTIQISLGPYPAETEWPAIFASRFFLWYGGQFRFYPFRNLKLWLKNTKLVSVELLPV